MRCWLILIVLGVATGGSSVAEDAANHFEQHVRPLLIDRCYACHSAEPEAKIKGGLRLDHRGGWERGGDSGPAVVPGRVEDSLLIQAVRYRDPELQMPPKQKLSLEEIAVLERWVAQGAYDPREVPVDAKEAHAAEEAPAFDLEEERAFWSFQPVKSPPIPGGEAKESWARAPLDAFLLRHWRGRQAVPTEAETSPAVMERRLSDAFTGLPPRVIQLPREERDVDDARERMVDRLLASPRYGERWGRHWLDVARFADSNGMDENMAYVEAYRYRDYVIDAFNADVPFDRFVTEQLAGDLLPGSGMREKVATGFLAIGPKMLACDDPQKMRMDVVDEQVETTGRAFLGMTFGCARCHDHKFDPVSIEDYYGLAGIFKSTKTLVDYRVVAKWHEYDLTPKEVREAHEKIDQLRKRAANKKLEPEEREASKAELEAWLARTPPRVKVMGVTENEVANARVHFRGNYMTLGEETPRQVPVVFQTTPVAREEAPSEESGRLQLARWIGARDNPLTARVMVNRLWRWHFGKGIVPSTDNFGKLGVPPRDQALLDHLAGELVWGDWSIKRVQRLLATSARYGMRVRPVDAESGEDLDRFLPAYHMRRRLSAESLRDGLLGLGGQLDLTMHGQLSEDQAGKYVNGSKLERYHETPRRSVYLPIIRSGLYASFVAFDMADPSVANGNRRESVVAPQSLYLMNGEQVHEAAAGLAQGLSGSEAEARLEALYERVLNRPPETGETQRALAFLGGYKGEDAWAALARVLFASNEFLYLN